MEQITYVSTSRSAVPSEAEIQHILQVSRRNNLRDGLTGLLVVAGRRFLQVLEGPSDVLDATYARISADSRHFAMVQLGRKPISEASFPDWAMGFEASGSGKLTLVVDRLTSTLTDQHLRDHLLSFAQLHCRAA
jgi:hypothetical protein